MFDQDSQIEARHKLLILYILSEFKMPLTNTQLTEFVMELHFIDYFTLQQYLVELIDKSLIEVSESGSVPNYLITSQGINALSFFNDRIPQDIKNRMAKAVVIKRRSIYRDAEILSEYRQVNEQEYIAHLRVEEHGHTLIDIELNLVTNRQAKDVCRRWKENAPEIYASLIRSLVSEDNATLENTLVEDLPLIPDEFKKT